MSRAEGIVEAVTWGGRGRPRPEQRVLDRVVSCREKRVQHVRGIQKYFGKRVSEDLMQEHDGCKMFVTKHRRIVRGQ